MWSPPKKNQTAKIEMRQKEMSEMKRFQKSDKNTKKRKKKKRNNQLKNDTDVIVLEVEVKRLRSL